MDYPPRIQALLEKYWKTETTVEEEKELRNYFVLHPEHGDHTTAYFQFLQLEGSIESPKVTAPVVRNMRRSRITRIVSIAAAVLLLVTAGIYFDKNPDDTATDRAVVDSFQDPNEAYQEAKEALMLISEKLNSSKRKAGEQIARAKPYTEILK